ncbi:hypothetical protein HYX01_02915 [Candidatus Woesearchaeota archaeon]|nr:hypothetical protein [Candidatus Woesearchaeota archaeon]
MDLSNKTIKELFYKQIKDLTIKTYESFDLQFSGKLIENKNSATTKPIIAHL